MSARSVLGLAIMVVGYALLGPGGLGLSGVGLAVGVAAVALAGSYLTSALFPTKSGASGDISKELTATTAQYGAVVPVVWGTCKVAPNIVRFEPDKTTINEIKENVGKGMGQSVTTGKEYLSNWETCYCVGPVDAVVDLVTSPGAVSLFGSTPLVFSGDTATVSVDDDGTRGGVVTFYRGSLTQTRQTSGDPFESFIGVTPVAGYNYRGFCWGLFGTSSSKYNCGGLSQAPGYAAIIRRIDQIDVGTTNINKRGSSDASHPHYQNANPAAILYECLTNTRWGLGIDPNVIDTASFVSASTYYATNNLGMSIMLDQAGQLRDLISHIQVHVKCALIMDNGVIRLVNLLAPYTGTIVTIKESDCSAMEITAGTYEATTNRVIAEYTNNLANYKSNTIDVSDESAASTVGARRTTRINLGGFVDPGVAQLQAQRVLRENSFPAAASRVTVNRRVGYGLQYGDVVRLAVGRYQDNSNEYVVTHYRVVRLESSSSSADDLTIELIEDLRYPRTISSNPDVVVNPTDYWGNNSLTSDDTTNTSTADYTTTPLDPMVIEPPPTLADTFDGPHMCIADVREKSTVLGFNVVWRKAGNVIWNGLGTKSCYALARGTVQTVPAGQRWMDRSATGFLVTIPDSAQAAAAMAACSLVKLSSDSMEVLPGVDKAWLVIGNEILQVGYLQAVSGTTYRVRNFLRGQWNSGFANINVGDSCFFLTKLSTSLAVPADGLPDASIEVQVYPVTRLGPNIDSPVTKTLTWNNRYRKPLAPYIRSATVAGGNITLVVEPILINNGAESGGLEQSLYNPPQTLDEGFSYVQVDNGGNALTAKTTLAGVWVPPNPNAAPGTTGVFNCTAIAKVTGAVAIRVYAEKGGYTSPDFDVATL